MQPQGRLVFVPEDSTLYEELDELDAIEDIHCLDSLNDLHRLAERLDMEGAVDIEQMEIERDIQRLKALENNENERLLWGLGGLLLGSLFLGGN